MRPAILPVDADKNPTDFSRRFGIYLRDDPPENPPWVDLDPDIFPDAIPNVRWRFGDQEGTYSTGDDRIWAVIQPALQYAGRILASNHPFW
ncbi:hypothetical protein FJTKL_13531 [Diaporthe vaccinii]|uniref:Uncharacterized protein n=1 Tax=Diaporthe vaccinii TaxID=105482 RepID=A0ABR4EA76_9PEZI